MLRLGTSSRPCPQIYGIRVFFLPRSQTIGRHSGRAARAGDGIFGIEPDGLINVSHSSVQIAFPSLEGQDDVIGFRDIEEQLNTKFKCSFFGWGVGGFGNFPLLPGSLMI
jgi:hypothetical protein